MIDKQKMRKIEIEELRKVYNCPRWIWVDFVFPNEIHTARNKLRLSGERFKTVKKFEDDKFVGYNIYMLR